MKCVDVIGNLAESVPRDWWIPSSNRNEFVDGFRKTWPLNCLQYLWNCSLPTRILVAPVSKQKPTKCPSPGCLPFGIFRGCSVGVVFFALEFRSSICSRWRMLFTQRWFLSLFFQLLHMSVMFRCIGLVLPLGLSFSSIFTSPRRSWLSFIVSFFLALVERLLSICDVCTMVCPFRHVPLLVHGGAFFVFCTASTLCDRVFHWHF